MNEEFINLNFKENKIFKGFGTSLSWFANSIGKSQDKASVDKLCSLLFDKNNENGLRLNFVRYNIGGVEDNSKTANFRHGGSIEAFVGNNDNNNWDTIDLGQRYFLKKAKEFGVENFEAFSNSPPNHMTVSGSTAGSQAWNIPFIKSKITFSNNLKPECVKEFASYLVNVTDYLIKKDNIPFSSISPFNEALNMGWVSTNNQEGCYYGLSGIRGHVTSSLRKQLDKQDMKKVDISCCEENSMFFGFLGLLFNPFMWKSVQRLNIHRYRWGDTLGFNTYNFEDSNIFRRIIKWIMKDNPIVMSEFAMGYLNGITDYTDFKNVLNLASFIMDDFIYLQPEMWCYWQIIEDLTGNGWGTLQVSFDNPSRIVYGAQYRTIQHFSHFIESGDIMLKLPKLKNKNLKWIGSKNNNGQVKMIILSNDSNDTTIQFNKYFSNTIISISDSKNLKCDGTSIIKTKISGFINKVFIPRFSLVSISFFI